MVNCEQCDHKDVDPFWCFHVLTFHSAAALKSIDSIGQGMVRDGTKCGADKVPCL